MLSLRRRIAEVLALCGLGCAFACATPPTPYTVDLTGADHRFRVGDDPSYADPALDDAQWSVLGSSRTWRVRTLGGPVYGWHRIHFRVTERRDAPQALDLGPVAWSDETYLNGVKVGATGRMRGVPRLGPRRRLYPIPEGALAEGPNVLAVRVMGMPLGANGFLGGAVGIGDALELERHRGDALSIAQLAEGLLFGFLGLSWLFVAFFPKRGRPGRATLFLLGTISLAMIMLWLLSETLLRAGLSPIVGGNVLLSVVSLIAAAYGGFVVIIATGGVPVAIRWMMGVQAVIAALFLSVESLMAPMIVAGNLNNLAAFAVVIAYLVRAIRAGAPGALPIAVGTVAGLLAVLAMFVVPSPFLAGLPLIYYGIVIAVAFGVIALIRHIHHLSLEIERKTEYSLVAHSRERSRLARDLHDGLGQMLALLKMQMQRLGRKHAGDPIQRAFDESASQVGATLDELRRVARDLRPAPMQDRSFGDAVREYAAAIEQRTDLAVSVSGKFHEDPAPGIADELYRIAQECLTNCLKHSGAHKVELTFADLGDCFQLTVQDDGRGLTASVPPGLGLATIRERSEILGGTCTIASDPGSGTRVEVRVPH